jgi:hypothetical protein
MVLMIPHLPEEKRSQGRIRLDDLKAQETEAARDLIQKRLDERRPLGTTCIASWCRYKVVSIRAEIGLHQGEDPIAVRERVLRRLHQTINPLPTPANLDGWPFGQPLRASNVYDITLAEPGVSYVDHVRLLVDEVPDQMVTALVADVTQPQTWFAATPNTLFRSINNADGWEAVARFPDEELALVGVHPRYAGLVAAVTQYGENGKASRIYLSHDCGENWALASQTAFRIRDVAWTMRDRQPVLLLATDVGLYELTLYPTAGPIQVLVNADLEEKGYYAVTSAVDVRGTAYVALAARQAGGVFLSSANGQPGSFTHIGFKDQPVRVLKIQQEGLRSFLWVGLAVPGNEEGQGCFSWELRGAEPPPEGWRQFKNGWTGGSCRGMGFQGKYVVVATHHGGVLRLDASKSDALWEKPGIDCGLPTRDVTMIFHPVEAVAVNPDRQHILAAGPEGIFRSTDARTYQTVSSRMFTDKVTLPKTWLFCSGRHEIKVIEADETQ